MDVEGRGTRGMGGQSVLSGESGQALADAVLAALAGFSVEYVMSLRS